MPFRKILLITFIIDFTVITPNLCVQSSCYPNHLYNGVLIRVHDIDVPILMGKHYIHNEVSFTDMKLPYRQTFIPDNDMLGTKFEF